jgi:hypothetical protein
MTKQLELAKPPYMPPYAADRAWEPDGRDEWIVDAMRHGFTDALEASIRMDERDPELRRPSGVEMVRFRSNRIGGSQAIDGGIVDQVMAMTDEEIENQAQWRHDNAEQLAGYPRACLDAFQQDIINAVDEAGQWDKAAAARWADAIASSRALTARWFDEDTHQLQAVGP